MARPRPSRAPENSGSRDATPPILNPARGRARSLSTETPTSEHPLAAVAPPPPAAPRRRRSPLSLLGIVVSVVALGAVVWWALHQDAPQAARHARREIAALLGAIALYALATVVRARALAAAARRRGRARRTARTPTR